METDAQAVLGDIPLRYVLGWRPKAGRPKRRDIGDACQCNYRNAWRSGLACSATGAGCPKVYILLTTFGCQQAFCKKHPRECTPHKIAGVHSFGVSLQNACWQEMTAQRLYTFVTFPYKRCVPSAILARSRKYLSPGVSEQARCLPKRAFFSSRFRCVYCTGLLLADAISRADGKARGRNHEVWLCGASLGDPVALGPVLWPRSVQRPA